MESQPAPLSVRNGPSGPASRIPTPSTQSRKGPTAPVSPVEICIEGQENPSVKLVAKQPKMTATVKPIRAVVAKKPVVKTKKAPIARGSTTVTAAPKKPVAKKPPTRPASSKPKGVTAAKSPAKASTAGANAKSGAAGGKTKRPAWDVKGRLQDVEAERNESRETVRALSKEMELVRQRLDTLQSENSQQKTTLKMKQQETRDTEEKLFVLEAKCRELQHEHSALQSVHAGTEMDLVASRSAISQLTNDYSTLQCRYDALKVSEDEAVAESVKKTNTISKLQLEVESHLATIAECEARRREDETIRRREDETIRRREDETIRRREDETIRRQFHNVIQELKEKNLHQASSSTKTSKQEEDMADRRVVVHFTNYYGEPMLRYQGWNLNSGETYDNDTFKNPGDTLGEDEGFFLLKAEGNQITGNVKIQVGDVENAVLQFNFNAEENTFVLDQEIDGIEVRCHSPQAQDGGKTLYCSAVAAPYNLIYDHGIERRVEVHFTNYYGEPMLRYQGWHLESGETSEHDTFKNPGDTLGEDESFFLLKAEGNQVTGNVNIQVGDVGNAVLRFNFNTEDNTFFLDQQINGIEVKCHSPQVQDGGKTLYCSAVAAPYNLIYTAEPRVQ